MAGEILLQVGTERLRLLREGLRIMALRALDDADAAEDVAQEALLRAMRAVTPEVAADDERLGAFVGGIARHVIADVRRRGARLEAGGTRVEGIADTARDGLTALVVREEGARVREALSCLPPADRELIRESFYDGRTPTEIARRTSEPVERIRKRKSRALARLRAALRPPPGEESGGGAGAETARAATGTR